MHDGKEEPVPAHCVLTRPAAPRTKWKMHCLLGEHHAPCTTHVHVSRYDDVEPLLMC